jgi:hypothetical protein
MTTPQTQSSGTPIAAALLNSHQAAIAELQALMSLGGSATLDYPSIAAGATADLTITVAGAAAGSVAAASPTGAIEAGLSWCAWVSAANTVTVRLVNSTTGAIDPASRTWTVRVLA